MPRTSRLPAKLSFFDQYRPKQLGDLPKYQQLRFAVIEAVRDGFWRNAAKLPTEEELVEITGFSLGTVQRAIRMLAQDGVLARRQGSGTFVAHRPSRIFQPWHFQFLGEDGVSVLPVYPKVVCRERTSQRGPWTSFLNQENEPLLRLDRLINVNDEFTAFSRFFIAGSYADMMENVPLAKLHGANFRVVLSETFRLPVISIGHSVSVIEASSEQSKKLLVPHDYPLLRVEIHAKAATEIPLYFQELICPASNRKLSLPSVGQL